jgi:hypothetical protein
VMRRVAGVQQECQLLESQIRDAIRTKQFDGLKIKASRLQSLLPGRQDLAKLLGQIENRDRARKERADRAIAAAHQHLQRGELEKAAESLNAVPKGMSEPELIALRNDLWKRKQEPEIRQKHKRAVDLLNLGQPANALELLESIPKALRLPDTDALLQAIRRKSVAEPARNDVSVPCEGPLQANPGGIAGSVRCDRFHELVALPSWLPWLTWAARLCACAAIAIKLIGLVIPPEQPKPSGVIGNTVAAVSASHSGNDSTSVEVGGQNLFKSIQGRFSWEVEMLLRIQHVITKAPSGLMLPTVLFLVVWLLTTAECVVTLLLFVVDQYRALVIPTITAFGLSILSLLLAASIR